MKYYLKVNPTGVITDAINYQVEGYIEYNTDNPLPAGVNGGWFKLENGVVVEHPELKSLSDNDRINALEIAMAQLLGI